MFHVLDHEAVVCSGNLSDATQYVLEYSGENLDDAVRDGIRILYTDARHSLRQAVCLDYWDPTDD